MRYLIIFALGFSAGAACLGILVEGADSEVQLRQYQLEKQKALMLERKIQEHQRNFLEPLPSQDAPSESLKNKGTWI